MSARVNKGVAATLASVLLVAAMGLPGCGKQEEQAATDDTAAVEQTDEADKTEEAAADEATELTIDEGLQGQILDAGKQVFAESETLDANIDDLPEAENDELDDLEVPDEVEEIDETDTKAGTVSIATTGVGMMVPTYWHPSYDASTDTAVFASDRYDLAGYIVTESRSSFSGDITSAASQHVRSLVNRGMFDMAQVADSGTMRSNGMVVGSYVVFLAQKGSEQYAVQTVFIMGRTKVSNVYMMYNLRDYDLANDDASDASDSLGYSQGETI